MENISNKLAYEKSLARMDELLKIVGNETNPASKEFLELDQLSDLIAAYEESNYSFKPEN